MGDRLGTAGVVGFVFFPPISPGLFFQVFSLSLNLKLSTNQFNNNLHVGCRTEEIEHVFYTRDHALCLNAFFTLLTSPASFPSQYGLGPRDNVNYQQEMKLQLGRLKGRSTLKTLQVGKVSSWSTGSVASPPSRTADPETVQPK